MKIILRRISQRSAEFLGFDRMGEAYPIFTKVYTFLWLYSTLETVFMNTLLIRLTGNSDSVMYYKMIIYVVTAVAMHGSALIAHRLSPVHSIRLSAVLYGIMYLFLFILTDYLGVYMPYLAVLSGVACGLYWCSHNILLTLYTTERNRDIGVGILGVINGIITLLIPIVSGFVITAYPNNYLGYRIMFGVGFASVIMQFIMSLRLYPVEHKTREPQFRLALSLVRQRKSVRFVFCSEFIRGFREGTFLFFLNTLLFEFVSDERLVGLNTFLTGAASIVAAWVYGRIVAAHLRGKFVVIATSLLMGATFCLFFGLNSVSIVIYSIVNAFLQLFVVNASSVSSFAVFTQDEKARFCLGESFAFREVSLALGRVVGIYVVVLFPKTPTGYISAMLLLTVTQYLVALCIRVIRRELSLFEQQQITGASVNQEPLEDAQR
ncbi:MFS transporter [Oscillospiraceae bacterium MB08-C2-2]|nr:MFS transporter [Oscillospiraceae bacterium MB08-C2-2]